MAIKLEVGKRYTTRDGLLVTIVASSDGMLQKEEFIGVVPHYHMQNKGMWRTWDSDGKSSYGNAEDIIGDETVAPALKKIEAEFEKLRLARVALIERGTAEAPWSSMKMKAKTPRGK